jgi:hypothetical protein
MKKIKNLLLLFLPLVLVAYPLSAGGTQAASGGGGGGSNPGNRKNCLSD